MKTITPALFLTVVSLSCVSCVFPGEVTPETRGRVLDASSKKPISGANIRVVHHTQNAYSVSRSGEDGKFVVPPARGLIYPMGSAVIVEGKANVSADGYRGVEIDSVRADEPTGFQFCELGDVLLKVNGSR